jgi:hypothetical protein
MTARLPHGVRIRSHHKKSFDPISALGALIKSSKYRVYSSGLILVAALPVRRSSPSEDWILDQNLFLRWFLVTVHPKKFKLIFLTLSKNQVTLKVFDTIKVLIGSGFFSRAYPSRRGGNALDMDGHAEREKEQRHIILSC